jgi:hypothetical protein
MDMTEAAAMTEASGLTGNEALTGKEARIQHASDMTNEMRHNKAGQSSGASLNVCVR